MPAIRHASPRSAIETEHLRTPPPRKPELALRSVQNSPEKAETLKKEHQRFVLTDPVAFTYLEDDPSTTVLERGSKLSGYECYVVEQWVVSRTDPTFMITTYTGDPKHIVCADVLGVPSDEKVWSPRLRVFFKALNQYHARRELTPLGTLIVTNLSGFPSSLTVIPVPDGILRNHRANFIVNENLKRLGCLGRLGLTLGSAPSNAIAKFYQIYHTSEKNHVHDSIVELVRLCQVALSLFGKLELDFADGLLCDVTEHAISGWWNDMGAEHYNIEPHDGLLGPTTVSALLGLLMGVRNRLRSYGITMPKDPFDLAGMKRGIASFQKQQRLRKTRRLDSTTIAVLIKATAKAAASDGWAVPKAVKSTVAELSGRGGEMLNDVVSKRDRAGIAEIETTDYDRFVHLAYGPHAKWLWHGKVLKRSGGFALSHTAHPPEHVKDTKSPDKAQMDDEPRAPGVDTDASGVEDNRTGLRKRATDLRNEAKSGLGKIKEAVHLRPRQALPRKQGQPGSPQSQPRASVEEPAKSGDSSPGSPFSNPTSPTSPALDRMPDFSLTARGTRQGGGYDSSRNQSPHQRQHVASPNKSSDVDDEKVPSMADRNREIGTTAHDLAVDRFTISGNLPEGIVADDDDHKTILRRTVSEDNGIVTKAGRERADLHPRHLSFSLAEDTVLPWSNLELDEADDSSLDERAVYAAEAYTAERQKHLNAVITELQTDASDWTAQQLNVLKKLVDQTAFDLRAGEEAYKPRAELVQSLMTDIDMLVHSEQERIEEGTKELETLAARLKYEIDGLKGRIEDVDQVVDDFESGVRRVEDRASELEKDDTMQNQGCVVS